MNNNKVRKYIAFTVAMFIMGIGVGMCSLSVMGTDPLTLFSAGIAQHMNWTLSFTLIVVQALCLAFAACVERDNISLATLISVVVGPWGIDAVYALIPAPQSLPFRIILMVVGLMIYGFGIASTLVLNVGLSVYDCLIMALARIFHLKEYRQARWIVDGTCLVLGIFLGGTFGPCTIVILLFAGAIVDLNKRLIIQGHLFDRI